MGATTWHGGYLMARTSRPTGNYRAGCSKRPSSKAAASEEARRTLRYVEPLSDARTPLVDFFSILLSLSTSNPVDDQQDAERQKHNDNRILYELIFAS